MPDEKLVDVLRKTLRKMSPAARAQAASFRSTRASARCSARAVAEGGARADLVEWPTRAPARRRRRLRLDIRDDFIDTIGNTPLIRLRRASEQTGCTILGQGRVPESGRLGQGPRGEVHPARRRGARASSSRGGVVVEGTAGNTGIGLALVGNARGYRTVIFIPDTQSQEKKDMLRLCGAELREVPAVPYKNPDNYVHQAERFAAELAKSGAARRPLREPVGQPLEPHRPRALDRSRDLGADRRTRRRLHLRDRHRRHALRRRRSS